ncbi:ribonuclease [Ruegeria phage RpAliso]|nr:ribonuclease [Ruegeria phage RpAliso]
MLRPALVEKIKAYLAGVSPDSKVYIGCDSKRRKNEQDEWFASYSTAVVIHVENSKGCKVFCDTEVMRDYDQRHDRPAMRMMNEAYKAVEAYQQLEDVLLEWDVEVHLDVNEDPKHGSNCALSMTRGYVAGVTGLPVKVKPEAFAASYAADHGVRGGFQKVFAGH